VTGVQTCALPISAPDRPIDGLNGCRNLGFRRSDADYVWSIDGDNYLVGNRVALDLMKPFGQLRDLVLSLPVPKVDSGSSSFNRWLVRCDLRAFQKLIGRSERVDNWFYAKDLSYGVTNSSVIRRSALEAVGGWDQDIRVLSRLRRQGLARAAVVPSARFFHRTSSNLGDYVRKLEGRLIRFGSMNMDHRLDYFVSEEGEPMGKGSAGNFLSQVILSPAIALSGLVASRDVAWLWGVCAPVWLGTLALKHPLASVSLIKNVL